MNLNFLKPEKEDQPLSFKIWAILVSVFALVLCFIFKDFIFHPEKLLVSSDQIQGFGGRYLRDAFFMSQWNPYLLGGMPTYDAMFGDVSHPMVLLERLMAPERAVGFKFILCTWVAFATALPLFAFLARAWKIGALVALLFALNPQFFTLVYGGHDGKMMVVSVLPLALWGIFQITRKGSWMGIFWIGLSTALMLLSSQLQTTYYALFGMLAISIYENFLREKIGSWKNALIKQASIGLGVVIALAIGAIQVLPPLEYTTTQSVRSTSEKMTLEHATSWSIHPEEAVSMILPGFSGNLPDQAAQKETYWGINAFKLNHDAPGMLLLILGIAAFSAANRRKEHILWAWMLSITVIYALGAHTPWFQFFFEYLPKAKMFRAPSMVLFWVPMIFGIMGSLWLGDVRKGEVQIKGGFVVAAITLFAGFAMMRSSWFEHSSILWMGFIVLSTLLFLGFMGLQNQGHKLKWSELPAATLAQFKSQPILSSALILPWLIFIPMRSSVQVQVNQLSDALITQEQWLSARELVMKNQSGEVFVSLFVGILLSLTLWWAIRKAQTWNFAFLVLALVGGLEAWWVDSKFVQTQDRSEIFKPEADEIAKKAKVITTGTDYRLLNLGQTLENGYGPYYGLRMVLGFHDNEIASYRKFRAGGDENSRMGNLLWVPPMPVLMQSMRAQGMDSAQLAKMFEPGAMDLLIAFFAVQNPGVGPDAIRQQLGGMPQEQLQSYWTQVSEQINKLPADQQQKLHEMAAQMSYGNTAMSLVIQNGLNPYLNVLGVKAIAFGEQIATNPKAFARITPYTGVKVMADSLAMTELANSSDYQNTIYLSEAPKVTPDAKQISAKLSPATRADDYQVQYKSDGNAVILFNENYSKNWQATLNGQALQMHRAFGTFLAFEVPKGEGVIEVKYTSTALAKAYPICGLGLIALLLSLVGGVMYRKKQLA